MANGWRKAMGDCGGPFTDALLALHPERHDPDGLDGARRRDDGVIELSANRTMRPSVGLDGDTFTACPVAGTDYGTVVKTAFRANKALEQGHLAVMYPEPSAALLDAAEVVGDTLRAVERHDAEVTRRNRQAGGGSKR